MARNRLNRYWRHLYNKTVKLKFFAKENPYLFFVLLCFFAVGLFLIFTRLEQLTLNSDDIMYLYSADNLVKNHTLSCQLMSLPTAFITPGMSTLLTPISLVFGTATVGAGYIASKLLMLFFALGVLTLVYLLGLKLFKSKLIASGAITLLAIYPPFMKLALLTLTEMPFTFLLLLLIHRFLIFIEKDDYRQLTILVLIYWCALMIRPSIFFIPLLLLPFYVTKKTDWKKLLLKASYAAVIIVVLMVPWWVRNYIVFDRFIPLSTGSSNPLMVGSYDIHDPVYGPLNFAYYRLDRSKILEGFATEENKEKISKMPLGDPGTMDLEKFYTQLAERGNYLGYSFFSAKDTVAFEKAEERFARERMERLFKESPREFLTFYLIKKPKYLWEDGYYLISPLNIPARINTTYHQLILLAFVLSLPALFIKNRKFFFSLALILLYFTALHAYYYSFPRYNFPLMPLLILVSSFGALFYIEPIYKYLLKIFTNKRF